MVSLGFFLDRNFNYPSTIAMFSLLFVFHAVGSELPRKRALITGWTAIFLMTGFTVSGVFAGYVSIGTPLLVFVFTSFPFILGLGSFAIPVSQIVVLVLLAAVAGVIAAIYPSWKASRMNVLAAISYE